jgi:hypothetical protein
LERWDGDVDWIGLAKDRNRWWALVNSVLFSSIMLVEEIYLLNDKPR